MRLIQSYGWVFLLMAGTGLGCGVAVAKAICFYTPAKFRSEAVVEVKPMSREKGTPRFFQSEVERFKSRECLAIAAARLQGGLPWAVDEEAAITALRKIVTMARISEGGRIWIGVDYGPTAYAEVSNTSSFLIAGALIDAYLESRLESHGPVTPGNFETKEIPVLRHFIKKESAKEEEMWQRLESISAIAEEANGEHQISDTSLAEAERNYEFQESFLKRLVEKTRTGTATDEPLIVLQQPTVGWIRVSPDVRLVWGLSLIGGILPSPLLALPLVMLLDRLKSAKEGGTSAHPG